MNYSLHRRRRQTSGMLPSSIAIALAIVCRNPSWPKSNNRSIFSCSIQEWVRCGAAVVDVVTS
jgi:hypothetical protein